VKIEIYILFYYYGELELELKLLDLLELLFELNELLLELLFELELLDLLELELELDEHTLTANSILVILNVPVESDFNSPISKMAAVPLNVRSNEVPVVYGSSFPIFRPSVSPILTCSTIPVFIVTLALIGLNPSAHDPIGSTLIVDPESVVSLLIHSLLVESQDPSSAIHLVSSNIVIHSSVIGNGHELELELVEVLELLELIDELDLLELELDLLLELEFDELLDLLELELELDLLLDDELLLLELLELELDLLELDDLLLDDELHSTSAN